MSVPDYRPRYERFDRTPYPPISQVMWDLRNERGLTQIQASARSGVGEKTLSSFETGFRIESLKVGQLQKLCRAYGITLTQFFQRVEEFVRS